MPSASDAFLDALGATVDLSDSERRALGARLGERTLDRGGALVRQGDRCDVVGFVAQGAMRITVTVDGDERTTYFATDGQMVSDYESVLTGAPARTTLEAVEPCTLSLLDRGTIDWAYGALRHGERLGRLVAENLFVATHRRLVSFYVDTAEARYLRLLDEHPGLVQRVPQHLIASYVGVRPQSLSRIRARLAGASSRRGSSPG